MHNIGEALRALASIWVDMFGAILSVFPKFIRLAVWFLLAFLILPCVFVAGTVYPAWVEWGEDF